MSQGNVEIVRAGIEAWNAEDMDALRELYHPDAIMRMAPDWPEPGPYFGREAVMREFAQLRETWDADASEVISVIGVADRVVVRSIWHTAGRGPDSNMEFTVLYTLREGRIFLMEYFWDHAEVLEAVELAEQDAHADSASLRDTARAMSQENVQIVRAVYERWSEGDFRAHVDLLDPHVVLVLGPDFPEAGMHSGIEAVAEYTRGLLEPWTHFTMEAEEIVAAGDSVLAGVCQRGVGSGSGVPTVLHYFTLWTFRGSKVVHLESFRERAEALEAVGLSE